MHIAAKRYLDVVEGLKKPNTLRKYKAVLNRFLDFFADRTSVKSITSDDKLPNCAEPCSARRVRT